MLGVRVPLRWRHFLSQKLWHFHKNTRLCVENECCCPRTVNISNVNFTSEIIIEHYILEKSWSDSLLHWYSETACIIHRNMENQGRNNLSTKNEYSFPLMITDEVLYKRNTMQCVRRHLITPNKLQKWRWYIWNFFFRSRARGHEWVDYFTRRWSCLSQRRKLEYKAMLCSLSASYQLDRRDSVSLFKWRTETGWLSFLVGSIRLTMWGLWYLYTTIILISSNNYAWLRFYDITMQFYIRNVSIKLWPTLPLNTYRSCVFLSQNMPERMNSNVSIYNLWVQLTFSLESTI